MRDRSDGAWYFEITKLKDLEERVFPFFDEFPLRGPKAGDLRIFRQIALLVRSREHLDPAGIARILELRSGMNRGVGDVARTTRSGRRWASGILRGHTQGSLLKRRDEDMVHASWRHEDQREL